MHIAMNLVQIAKGKEADFGQIWAERDFHLEDVPGFGALNLLKRP